MPLLGQHELRERIGRLAAIERPSASAGERRAAELIAADLRATLGDAHLEEEHAHGTYWWPLGIPTALAALAGAGGSRLRAAGIALAAAASVADDVRIGPRLLRRLLPKRPTVNVVAEAGAPDAPHTVVLVAHHDAAHTGLVFHPELPRAVVRRFPRVVELTNTTPPTIWPAFAGPLAVALGALLGARTLRRLGTFVSAGFALAMADVGARRTVPGANDNLSGVAVVLSVARALADEPVPGVRVILLSTGSEESFSEGMEAFMARHRQALAPERTSVVCVDTVGSPELLLLEGEGMLGVRPYPRPLVELVHGCAREAGVHVRAGLRFRNATDGLTALRLGYPTAMLGSVDEFRFPTNYHWPTDTADNVDYGTVADAARLCLAVIRRLARGAPDPAGAGAEPAGAGSVPPGAAAAQSNPSTSRT